MPQTESKSKTFGDYLEMAEPYLEILGDLANIVVHISARPRPKDYAAIGMASAGLAMKLRQKIKSKEKGLQNWFENNEIETWYIGLALKEFLYQISDNIEIIEESGDDRVLAVCFGQEKIYICFEPIKKNRSELASAESSNTWDKHEMCLARWGVKPARSAALFMVIKEKCWSFSNSHMYLSQDSGLIYKKYKSYDDYKETKFIKTMQGKIDLARKHDFLGRGFLVLGKPGTGKTTGIDYILAKFKKRTLRVNMDFLDYNRSNNISRQLKTDFYFSDMVDLVTLTKPECIIFDDLDYVMEWNQKRLLHLFEELIYGGSIVMATVNDKSKILEAVQRPGRLDELIEIDGIDINVLQILVDEDDLVHQDKLRQIPISHLKEFLKRKKMYSADEALAFVEQYLEKQISKEENSDLDIDKKLKKKNNAENLLI